MSQNHRSLLLAAAFVAATGAAFAGRQSAPVQVANPLRVSLFANASTHGFDGVVQLKLTNNSSQVVKVPYWQLPSDHLESSLFQVTAAGRVATYTGPLVKRGAPTEADMVVFQPYETKVVSVDLAKFYDLSGGDASVRLNSVLQGARTGSGAPVGDASGRLSVLQTAPLRIWLDGASLKRDDSNTAKPGSTATVVNGIAFKGCSTTQISGAGQAVVDARLYTENAKTYLNGGTVGPRYTTWFGTYTSSRYGTMQNHFVAIDTAMDYSSPTVAPNQVTINCGCNQSYYAYVYPTKPYEIFVCKAFWTAPATGTDSKAGTLVHEMSHFNVTAGTNDWVYGQTGAKNLAISNPDQAIDNADNHEYFGENNPKQN
jgi:peptidyl-Lys metalloendopeptidase